MSCQAYSNGPCIAHLASDIEVAVAALGVARCAGSLPSEFRAPLREVQRDLHELGSAMVGGTAPLLNESQIQRLDMACREYSSQPPPDGFAEFGGTVESVGFLQLARAHVRRVERTVLSVAESGRSLGQVLRYLNQLDQLLVILAYEAERQDEALVHAMALGICGGGVPEAGSKSHAH
ncbi:ATP:cob(I)alamin adenosyltransferase [Rhodococcus sp. WS3]|uniref:ATP:cob(I)alamin adenosyltransferase n=1 Tax=Rhodococcus sp. WS3 TaxID=2486271 RepID=UPI001144B581|nr:hypothetical protein [Rhodococcus sp. WS3]ROZ49026.1 ATP:cob(I)alamin adenosyltransferase [Rhodococcus sp. WS3]